MLPVLPNRKLGDGLFLQCCREVASGYPDISFDAMIVDNTTMQVTEALFANDKSVDYCSISVTLLIACVSLFVFGFFSLCPNLSSLM